MADETVLITGGAGFIGSHVADALLREGYAVRAFDSLSPQVHGADRSRPDYLDRRVDLRVGDLRDPQAVADAVEGVGAVIHLAAAVGVGQSMYEMAEYTGTNDLGTAVLLEALMDHPASKLVVASSMSIYGEGRYRGPDGTFVDDATRTRAQLRAHRWEPRATSPDGGEVALEPVATPEEKQPALTSVYALNKFAQERLCLIAGEAHRRPTVALRFFNVFGPRQALSNPYTGVIAIFASRLLNGRRPLVFEDGHQRRDFVSVHDVARACLLALESEDAVGQAFNIGSGHAATVRELARRVSDAVDRPELEPEITGRFRAGDIRHCFADISRARAVLGYAPRVSLADGIDELAGWLRDQEAADHTEAAHAELEKRGLTL